MTQTTVTQKRKPLIGKEVVGDVCTSDSFRDYARQPGVSKVAAFGRASLELAQLETSPSGLRSPEGHAYALASLLNGFSSSSLALEKKGFLTKQQAEHHKLQVISFNHELRDMVDSYQSITPQELDRMLTEIYITLNRHKWTNKEQATLEVDRVHSAIESRMYGMWSEINGAIVIGAAGYDVDTDVTGQDELHGIDGWVDMRPELTDRGRMHVDFKGDWRAADEANRQHPDSRALWSQLTRQDYRETGSFRISPQLARAKAPGMKQELEGLYAWHTRNK